MFLLRVKNMVNLDNLVRRTYNRIIHSHLYHVGWTSALLTFLPIALPNLLNLNSFHFLPCPCTTSCVLTREQPFVNMFVAPCG